MVWWNPIRTAFLVVEKLAAFVFWVLNRRKDRGRLPGVHDPLLLESAVSLAGKIRRREVSAEKVVTVHVYRALEAHLYLNCLAFRRFQEAMQEAKRVDLFLATTEKDVNQLEQETPFLGVPFTCKESLAVKGLEHSSGFIPRQGHVAKEDAEVVKLMKQAGAILIATTSVPELSLWWETVNPLRGRTSNPYDFRRSPGGSSGGEAALVASAGSPFGLGSDFYGSVRMPAHFCGIFGHKPTGKLVPSHGNFPEPEVDDGRFVIGPIARTATDCRAVTRVLCPRTALSDRTVTLKSLKVYFMAGCGGLLTSSVHEDGTVLQQSVVSKLKKEGCVVEEVKIDEASFTLWIFLLESMERGDCLRKRINYPKEEPINPFLEILKFSVGKSIHVWPLILSALAESLASFIFKVSFIRKYIQKRAATLRSRFHDLLEGDEDAIFIYPTMPHAALYHGQSYFLPFNSTYAALFSLLQLPVTQVPLGLSQKEGLPIGVQIAAGSNRDWLTLAVAAEVEKLMGGWVPPWTLQSQQKKVSATNNGDTCSLLTKKCL